MLMCRLTSHNPLFFFINALTMALGNVNDAPVRLNALIIENARLSLPVLQERLMVQYGDEFFGQLYRVLGSADVIGCASYSDVPARTLTLRSAATRSASSPTSHPA